MPCKSFFHYEFWIIMIIFTFLKTLIAVGLSSLKKILEKKLVIYVIIKISQ